MLRKVLHSKIHMAVTTMARPDYVGSITIDEDLLRATGMRVNDAVLIANCRNGARFETYIFRGEPGKRQIEVNGAAAHLVEPGDKLIILHWAQMDDAEYAEHRPTVLIMNEDNSIDRVTHYEPSDLEAIEG
ncbi:MAG: aspartate 1-decarboxylase [Planctomycetota bacterium]